MDSLHLDYFDKATAYYVAGRFAFFAELTEVAGNLYHHAIEMYLKGCLVRAGVSEEKRRKLGHRLDETWAAFRQDARDPALDRFKGVIDDLHVFEKLRYPESAPLDMAVALEHKRGDIVIDPTFSVKHRFHLILGDLDDLVIALHRAGSVNASALMVGVEGKRFLTRANANAGSWSLAHEVQTQGMTFDPSKSIVRDGVRITPRTDIRDEERCFVALDRKDQPICFLQEHSHGWMVWTDEASQARYANDCREAVAMVTTSGHVA